MSKDLSPLFCILVVIESKNYSYVISICYAGTESGHYARTYQVIVKQACMSISKEALQTEPVLKLLGLNVN